MLRAKLLHAQQVSLQLMRAVENRGLIRAGKTEAELNAEVTDLALRKFHIGHHWHKKIVRSGKNTLATYPDNPADRRIGDDDIVFIDLGPIVDGYEADIGRTYVVGDNPHRLRIRDNVEEAWHEIREWYQSQTSVRASDLYHIAAHKAKEYGWEFGGAIAGHIVGKFPHEQPEDPQSPELDIHPDNHQDLFRLDANGCARHWILELQFVDREREIGAYFD